jgi:hypothetical protein
MPQDGRDGLNVQHHDKGRTMINIRRLKGSLALAACAVSLAALPSAVLAQADMKGMMKENNDKMMAMQMSGNPDIDFAMMMREHHKGALEMAQMEMKNGKDPQMRKMAQKIIAAQKKEIAEFDKFLAKKGHTDHKK